MKRKTKKLTRQKGKFVTVNDSMQKGYCYALSARMGRDFDAEFKPELTPQKMLALGVFCGKYMTDTRKEFPKSWFKRAKLSPSGREPFNRRRVSLTCSQIRSDPTARHRHRGAYGSKRDPCIRPVVRGLQHTLRQRGCLLFLRSWRSA